MMNLMRHKAYLCGLLSCLIAFTPVVQAESSFLPVGTRVSFTLPNTVTSRTIEKRATSLPALLHLPIKGDICDVFQKGDPITLNIEKHVRNGAAGKRGKLLINSGTIQRRDGEIFPINFSYSSKGKGYAGLTIPMAFVGGLLIPLFGLGIPIVVGAFAIKGKPASMSTNVVYQGLTTSPIEYDCTVLNQPNPTKKVEPAQNEEDISPPKEEEGAPKEEESKSKYITF